MFWPQNCCATVLSPGGWDSINTRAQWGKKPSMEHSAGHGDNDKKSDDSVEKLDGWQLAVVQNDKENQSEPRKAIGKGAVR